MGRSSDVAPRLLDILAAHDGPAGICPRIPRLAKLLDVSTSTIQRALRQLESAGLVERIPVFERDDNLEWKQRQSAGFTGEAPRRQTSNTYRLRDSATGPGVSNASRNRSSDPGSTSNSATPRKGERPVPPVEGWGVVTDDGDQDSATGVSEVWPAYADSRYYRGPGRRAPTAQRSYADSPVRLHVPKRDQLDHDPKDAAEILGILRAGLGEVEVLDVWRHPTYATARGRVVNLETCSTSDMHRALDQLDRDTCWGGPCPKGCRSRCIPRCLPDGRRRCHRHRRHNGGAK